MNAFVTKVKKGDQVAFRSVGGGIRHGRVTFIRNHKLDVLLTDAKAKRTDEVRLVRLVSIEAVNGVVLSP